MPCRSAPLYPLRIMRQIRSHWSECLKTSGKTMPVHLKQWVSTATNLSCKVKIKFCSHSHICVWPHARVKCFLRLKSVIFGTLTIRKSIINRLDIVYTRFVCGCKTNTEGCLDVPLTSCYLRLIYNLQICWPAVFCKSPHPRLTSSITTNTETVTCKGMNCT